MTGAAAVLTSSISRLLPSLTVGEYGPPQDRPDDGGLYPLEEAGSYGDVPRQKYKGKWKPPQPYVPRERKPKVYASYAICECCVQEQEMDRRTSSYRSQEMDRRGATSYRRYRDSQASLNDRSERAASAPPQTTGSPKKQVKFVKRSVSEPTKSTVEEELGILSKLRLAKEVKKDTIESLRDDY